MKAPNVLNLAMIGCGDIAGTYLASAKKSMRCRIVQVMDVNMSLAEARGREYGASVAARYEDVLADPQVDAVIISVPHYLHASMAILALEAGKHVMCDKPIATNLTDGRRMIEAAKRAGRKLTINYVMRCSDKARYARRLIQDGMIGDVIAINIVAAMMKPEDYWSKGWNKVTQTDWRMSKAKAGGGVTIMNASHYMDLLFHLTGLSAAAATGFAGTLNSPAGVEVEDMAAGALKLRNGGIMSVLASSCYCGGLPGSMSVLGRKGQLDMQNGGDEILRVFLDDAAGTDFKAHEWLELPVSQSGRPGGYSDLMDDFAAAVLDGAPVPVDPWDAFHTMACVLAIYGENAELPPGYGDPAKPA